MPAPRGVPKIEVTFDIDANGIVNVSAKDTATGKEQKITITASSGLADKEIDRMVDEAEKYKAEDEQRKKVIETKNKAEQIAYATEKTLDEHKDKLPAEDVAKVEEAIKSLRSAVDSDDIAKIEAEMEKLTKASHKIAEVMYQAAAGASVPPGAGAQEPSQTGSDDSSSKDDGDVIDAEFEENKE